MTNAQIDRQIRSFDRIRQNWINILNDNPDSDDAPVMIMRINAKINLLRTLRTYED